MVQPTLVLLLATRRRGSFVTSEQQCCVQAGRCRDAVQQYGDPVEPEPAIFARATVPLGLAEQLRFDR
jgi:hypothetical protein